MCWLINLITYVLDEFCISYNLMFGNVVFFTFGIAILLLIAMTVIGTIMLFVPGYKRRSLVFKLCYFINIALFVIWIYFDMS